MFDGSVFNLICRQWQWYLWSLKSNWTDWPDADTYINEDSFLPYAKWFCSTFLDFDWFYNELNVGNPMFDPANFEEYVYVTFLHGLVWLLKMLKYWSFCDLTVAEHLKTCGIILVLKTWCMMPGLNLEDLILFNVNWACVRWLNSFPDFFVYIRTDFSRKWSVLFRVPVQSETFLNKLWCWGTKTNKKIIKRSYIYILFSFFMKRSILIVFLNCFF